MALPYFQRSVSRSDQCLLQEHRGKPLMFVDKAQYLGMICGQACFFQPGSEGRVTPYLHDYTHMRHSKKNNDWLQ